MVWMNPNHIASEENTIPHVMNAAPMCARVRARARLAGSLSSATLGSSKNALTFGQRPKCLVSRNDRQDLVVVPWLAGFLWRLDLHKVHVVNQPSIRS